MLEHLIIEFRGKLQEDYVLGPFSKTTDPAFIECMGYAGFDFVIIDMEHGPVTTESAQNLIRAAQLTGILPLIRVKKGSYQLIKDVLDIGAGGILVPHINKVEDIKKILDVSRFAPEGMRGICKYVRAANYSALEKYKYFKEANKAIIVIQLEGLEAIKNIDDIIEFGKFDVLFIGPYDLSQALGVAGKIDHPLVEEKVLEVIEKCKSKNILVGSFADTGQNAEKWIEMGIKFMSISVDVGIFYQSCKNIVGHLSCCKKK